MVVNDLPTSPTIVQKKGNQMAEVSKSTAFAKFSAPNDMIRAFVFATVQINKKIISSLVHWQYIFSHLEYYNIL